jgi:hypothetical protein
MKINGIKKNKWVCYNQDFSKMNPKVLHTQEKIVLAYKERDLDRVRQLQKESVKDFRAKIKQIIRRSYDQTRLIQELNGVLREWGNLYKGSLSKRTFSSLDWYITGVLMKWSLRKHSGRNSGGKKNIYRRTFKKMGGVKWRFVSMTKTGQVKAVLIMLSKLPSKRPIVHRNALNPFKQEHKNISKRSVVKSVKEKKSNH